MMIPQQKRRVLVFNPNTNLSINETLKPILSKLNLANVDFAFWTCPQGLSIIKSQQDMYDSTIACLPLLLKITNDFDGFLGACYADHPLMSILQSHVAPKPVVSIFNASINAALQTIEPRSRFGIITTGSLFESLLSQGVVRLLHDTDAAREEPLQSFAGVVATDIGMEDLGRGQRTTARQKMMSATTELLNRGDIGTICVGGVILVGMENWIREACEKELGREAAKKVKIIDQISAGGIAIDAILRDRAVPDFAAAVY